MYVSFQFLHHKKLLLLLGRISKEGAMYSEDRKTVTLEVGFMDVLKDPELLDFEVVLEDK